MLSSDGIRAALSGRLSAGIVEFNGEAIASRFADVFPGRAEFDRAGFAFDFHAVVRGFLTLALDRAKVNLAAQEGERFDLAKICIPWPCRR